MKVIDKIQKRIIELYEQYEKSKHDATLGYVGQSKLNEIDELIVLNEHIFKEASGKDPVRYLS